MLVPGLKNEELSTMISNSNGHYSDVHQLLYECAQAMLDKYKQKQATPETSYRLRFKTRAVAILLLELSNVPEDADADATREALSSALARYAEELQGYEHLLSEKGNNYELMKQTQGLRDEHEPASLLRYYHLKNKLLGSDSPLSDEQKECISRSEKEGLKLDLESFVLLDEDPGFFTKDMMSLKGSVAN